MHTQAFLATDTQYSAVQNAPQLHCILIFDKVINAAVKGVKWTAIWCGPWEAASPLRLNATQLLALFADDHWTTMPIPKCSKATYIIISVQRP